MKKFSLILYLIITMFCTGNISAQNETSVYGFPLDSVRIQIEESADPFKEICQRTLHLDSVVTAGDLFWIYYGSAYVEGYSPYSEKLSTEIVYDLLDEEKYEEAIEASEDIIRSHPGFTRPFYLLGVACDRMGDTVKAAGYFERYYDYLSIPYFSGNGQDFDSAFVVRNIDDEYLIISELGYNVTGQALVFDNGIPYDIMSVTDPEEGQQIDLYFNISQPYLIGLNFMDDIKDKKKKDKKRGRKKRGKKKINREE